MGREMKKLAKSTRYNYVYMFVCNIIVSTCLFAMLFLNLHACCVKSAKKQCCEPAILQFARYVPNANVNIALMCSFKLPWLLALGAFELPFFYCC